MGFTGYLLASCLVAAPVQSQGSAPEAPPPTQEPHALTPEELELGLQRVDRPGEKLLSEGAGSLGRLLLDWGGARKWLEDHGLAIDVLYATDASWAPSGGADPDGTALRSLLDVSFYYDLGRKLGLEGGTLFADVQWITGVNGSERFGVLQSVSNIDAEHRLQLSRFWYEQEFKSTKTRLRVGKIDANSLFAYVNSASYFLNGSMGFSPTILAMPTYPDPSFGLALTQGLGAGFSVRGGVFDGSGFAGVRTGQGGIASIYEPPDDTFLIGELDYKWDASLPGRAGLGVWGLDGEVARFDGGTQSSTGGIYATLDQRLWNSGHDDGENVGGFLQLGLADEAVSPFTGHVGGGLVWSEAFSSLRNDFLGLGVTHAQLSDSPSAGFTESYETAFELFLGFEALPWMRVKPDLQYVVHPGGDASLDNAWIATVRVTLAL